MKRLQHKRLISLSSIQLKWGGAAVAIRHAMQDGAVLIQVKEKSRTRYKLNNEFVEPRIVRQLEKRGLVKLGDAR